MVQVAISIAQSLLNFTYHGEVVKAMEDLTYAKVLVKRFSDQRKIALTISGAILAFYIHSNRMTAAAHVIILILLTSHISSVYDGINEHTFKAYTESIGPVAFTVINMLPGVASQILLCIELVRSYPSKLGAGAIILLVALPGALQFAAGLVYTRAQAAPIEP